MTGKMKAALGGGAALAGGSAAGVTAHEYSWPVYFTFSENENKQQKSALEILEVIRNMGDSETRKLKFSEKCIVWIQKMDSSGQTESNKGLVPEWEKKILNNLTGLSGFFKKSNLRSFLRRCGNMKHVKLRLNSGKIGWEVKEGGDLFE